MLSLNTVKTNKNINKDKKILGRGNSSGLGNYCGKGMKGQRSRSGVTGLKRLGMKAMLVRIPKLRGFKSLALKDQIINLGDLNKNFKDNDQINPKVLFEKGLIANSRTRVKILGEGELKLKGLVFEKVKMSKSVKEKLGIK
jgi:large subunit ribosomal protein L15